SARSTASALKLQLADALLRLFQGVLLIGHQDLQLVGAGLTATGPPLQRLAAGALFLEPVAECLDLVLQRLHAPPIGLELRGELRLAAPQRRDVLSRVGRERALELRGLA